MGSKGSTKSSRVALVLCTPACLPWNDTVDALKCKKSASTAVASMNVTDELLKTAFPAKVTYSMEFNEREVNVKAEFVTTSACSLPTDMLLHIQKCFPPKMLLPAAHFNEQSRRFIESASILMGSLEKILPPSKLVDPRSSS